MISALELREEINKALAGTYVQMVTVKGLTVTLTTMESTKATLLNGKVGSFLHLIPGTVSAHWDTQVTHLLVQGIRASYSMDAIASELTPLTLDWPLLDNLDGLLLKNHAWENLPQKWSLP